MALLSISIKHDFTSIAEVNSFIVKFKSVYQTATGSDFAADINNIIAHINKRELEKDQVDNIFREILLLDGITGDMYNLIEGIDSKRIPTPRMKALTSIFEIIKTSFIKYVKNSAPSTNISEILDTICNERLDKNVYNLLRECLESFFKENEKLPQDIIMGRFGFESGMQTTLFNDYNSNRTIFADFKKAFIPYLKHRKDLSFLTRSILVYFLNYFDNSNLPKPIYEELDISKEDFIKKVLPNLTDDDFATILCHNPLDFYYTVAENISLDRVLRIERRKPVISTGDMNEIIYGLSSSFEPDYISLMDKIGKKIGKKDSPKVDKVITPRKKSKIIVKRGRIVTIRDYINAVNEIINTFSNPLLKLIARLKLGIKEQEDKVIIVPSANDDQIQKVIADGHMVIPKDATIKNLWLSALRSIYEAIKKYYDVPSGAITEFTADVFLVVINSTPMCDTLISKLKELKCKGHFDEFVFDDNENVITIFTQYFISHLQPNSLSPYELNEADSKTLCIYDPKTYSFVMNNEENTKGFNDASWLDITLDDAVEAKRRKGRATILGLEKSFLNCLEKKTFIFERTYPATNGEAKSYYETYKEIFENRDVDTCLKTLIEIIVQSKYPEFDRYVLYNRLSPRLSVDVISSVFAKTSLHLGNGTIFGGKKLTDVYEEVLLFVKYILYNMSDPRLKDKRNKILEAFISAVKSYHNAKQLSTLKSEGIYDRIFQIDFSGLSPDKIVDIIKNDKDISKYEKTYLTSYKKMVLIERLVLSGFTLEAAKNLIEQIYVPCIEVPTTGTSLLQNQTEYVTIDQVYDKILELIEISSNEIEEAREILHKIKISGYFRHCIRIAISCITNPDYTLSEGDKNYLEIFKSKLNSQLERMKSKLLLMIRHYLHTIDKKNNDFKKQIGISHLTDDRLEKCLPLIKENLSPEEIELLVRRSPKKEGTKKVDTDISILNRLSCQEEDFLAYVLPMLSIMDLIYIKKHSRTDYETWIKPYLDQGTIEQIEKNMEAVSDVVKSYTASTLNVSKNILNRPQMFNPRLDIIRKVNMSIKTADGLTGTLYALNIQLPIFYKKIFINACLKGSDDEADSFCVEHLINKSFYTKVSIAIKQLLTDLASSVNLTYDIVLQNFINLNIEKNSIRLTNINQHALDNDPLQFIKTTILRSYDLFLARLLLNQLGLSCVYDPDLNEKAAAYRKIDKKAIEAIISDSYTSLENSLKSNQTALLMLKMIHDSLSKAKDIKKLTIPFSKFETAAKALSDQQLVNLRTNYLVIYKRFVEPYLDSSVAIKVSAYKIKAYQEGTDEGEDIYKYYLSLLALKVIEHRIVPCNS